MLHTILKLDQLFMCSDYFKSTEINGMKNYYQKNSSDHNGRIHFYRIDFVGTIGVIIESSMNFQDAVRNVYEDSIVLPHNAEVSLLQESILSLLSKNEPEPKSTIGDENIVIMYQYIMKMFKSIELLESKLIKNKLYFFYNDNHYKINFDYEEGFILEIATSFRNAEEHIHEIIGKYPLSLSSQLVPEIRKDLLIHLRQFKKL